MESLTRCFYKRKDCNTLFAKIKVCLSEIWYKVWISKNTKDCFIAFAKTNKKHIIASLEVRLSNTTKAKDCFITFVKSRVKEKIASQTSLLSKSEKILFKNSSTKA